ncbi:hypothetical protein D3C84_1144990 [compost metagenome]
MDTGQQQALPRCETQAAVALLPCQLCDTPQHRGIETPQRRHCADVHALGVTLRMRADVQEVRSCDALPTLDGFQRHSLGQPSKKRVE